MTEVFNAWEQRCHERATAIGVMPIAYGEYMRALRSDYRATFPEPSTREPGWEPFYLILARAST